jgi:hypothetical protein
MDNLSDWLYIVLLVIAGISGLLGSVKKVKQPKEILGQPDLDPVPDFDEDQEFWDWETKPIPKPVETEKKEKTPPPTPRQSTYTPLFIEGERNIHPAVNIFNQPEESYQETSPHIPVASPGDIDEWKKAIIYSEILNRKY